MGSERGKSIPVNSMLSFPRGTPGEQSTAGGRTRLPKHPKPFLLFLELQESPQGSQEPRLHFPFPGTGSILPQCLELPESA